MSGHDRGADPQPGSPAFDVIGAGPLSIIEDLGRPGRARLGVSDSGAFDRGALRLGNRLLGTVEGAAGVEILGSGLTLRARRPVWFALTGAEGAARLDGVPVDWALPRLAPSGSTLRFERPSSGLRTTLTLRGGVAAKPVLGSRSLDALARLGPAPLAAGDVLSTGSGAVHPIAVVDWMPLPRPIASGEVARLPLHRGPRSEWFAEDAWTRLLESTWTVTGTSDRTGIRLDGRPLARTRTDELPSEGMVRGALQVPPSGLPTILGADHPVTGGYPVIAVVRERGLDALAHLEPGRRVRFSTR